MHKYEYNIQESGARGKEETMKRKLLAVLPAVLILVGDLWLKSAAFTQRRVLSPGILSLQSTWNTGFALGLFPDTALTAAVLSGLMLGLIKPNLTWTNEAEAVKQGLPVSITLLAGMALPPVMGLLVFLLRKVFDVTPYLWLIPTAGAILVNGWIFKKGGRRLNELS